jgi:hypothetical protein
VEGSYCITQTQYSKTSLIRSNLERILVQISESPHNRNTTKNMFREVIKWTSRVFLRNTVFLIDCIL